MKDRVTLNIYMQDGRVFQYNVVDSIKAREHAHRIINYGWRTMEGKDMVYYPVHQILKVKWEMTTPDKLSRDYEMVYDSKEEIPIPGTGGCAIVEKEKP